MDTPIIDDNYIVKAICDNEKTRENALIQLFNNSSLRNAILQYVKKNSGSNQDAEDVFQDALIIFDRNVRNRKFEHKSSVFTYFFAIAKWKWLGVLRSRKINIEIDDLLQIEDQYSFEKSFFDTEKKEFLEKILDQIGDRCKTLLNLYKLSFSMAEIAQEYGLSSAEMAKKETYRCREKMRNYIEQHPNLLKFIQ